MRTAFSVTDEVFRWLGCEFIKGHREAISPDHAQTELPVPEVRSSKWRRPPSTAPSATCGSGRSRIRGDRVAAALGTAYMDVPCSHCGSEKVTRAGKPSVRRATRFYRNASRCLRDSPSSIIATTTLLML
jgi:hypothetical protein